mgnify:CR=1 FL=1
MSVATDALREAFLGWYNVFRNTMDCASAYTQFTSQCYRELIKAGVPSAEASVMSTELLKIHLTQFFSKQEKIDNTQLKILQQFTPNQEH